jgi:hypothetical protein
MCLASVIVHELDIFGVASRPAKADPELIVHPQPPLTCAIALQLLETVRLRRTQVVDAPREVELLQLAQRRTLDVGEARHAPQPEQCLSVGTLERSSRPQ